MHNIIRTNLLTIMSAFFHAINMCLSATTSGETTYLWQFRLLPLLLKYRIQMERNTLSQSRQIQVTEFEKSGLYIFAPAQVARRGDN